MLNRITNCGTSPAHAVCKTDIPVVNPIADTASNERTGTIFDAAGAVTQERLFKYDSLSRLTHERQTEGAGWPSDWKHHKHHLKHPTPPTPAAA
ncbi:MAG: hypothetical protein C4287_23385, partial [Leptolyngbya sp. ERB_1_2]